MRTNPIVVSIKDTDEYLYIELNKKSYVLIALPLMSLLLVCLGFYEILGYAYFLVPVFLLAAVFTVWLFPYTVATTKYALSRPTKVIVRRTGTLFSFDLENIKFYYLKVPPSQVTDPNLPPPPAHTHQMLWFVYLFFGAAAFSYFVYPPSSPDFSATNFVIIFLCLWLIPTFLAFNGMNNNR